MTMIKNILKIVSLGAAVGTIVPPVLYLTGTMDLGTMKWWMAVSTVVWFAATPMWMER